MKPRLLDLFCGAGGAAVGYARAGFEVVGVDIKPQPNFPFEFVQDNAMNVPWSGYDVIHASPPCQAFTQMSARWRGKGTRADTHPDFLTPVLRRLYERFPKAIWVVENVQGARKVMGTDTITLHGGMFGLGVHRPRVFKINGALVLTPKDAATRSPIGVYGTYPDGRWTYRYRNNKSLIRSAKSLEEARAVMGIDWMTWKEIREAIPPAYTEFLGLQLRAAILPAAKAV